MGSTAVPPGAVLLILIHTCASPVGARSTPSTPTAPGRCLHVERADGSLGREHKHRTLRVHVSDTTITIDLPDADDLTVRRTTTQPLRSIKGQRPRTAEPSVS